MREDGGERIGDRKLTQGLKVSELMGKEKAGKVLGVVEVEVGIEGFSDPTKTSQLE